MVDDEFRAYGTEVGWFCPSTDIEEGQNTDHGGRAREVGELENIAYYLSTISEHHLAPG